MKFIPILFLALLAVQSCAPRTTVIRDGREVTVDEASRLDYIEGEKLRRKNKILEAEKMYQSIINAYPDALFADDALFRLAQIAQRRKNTTLAIQFYQKILAELPDSNRANSARSALTILFADQERYEDAARLLGKVQWDNVPDAQKKELWEAAKATFDKVEAPHEQILFLISVYDARSDEKARARLEVQILDLVNTKAERGFLKDLVDERGERFPAGYAVFRLAQLSYLEGDRDRARTWLGALFNRYPGHPTTEEATILAENIAQSERVDPKALGLLLPLSGKNQFYGEKVLRGVALAMDVYGGTLSPNIELYIGDSGNSAEEALSSARNLVLEHNVIALVGPLFFEQTRAVAQASQEYDLPMVSLSAAENVTELGRRVFRNSLTKSEQANGLAFLTTRVLKNKRVAILYPNNSYGNEFKRLFWKRFQELGGEIRGVESYDPQKNDFGRAIQRLTGVRPWEVRSDEVCKARSQIEAAEKLLEEGKIPECYPRRRLPPVVDFEYLFVPDKHSVALQVAPLLPYYDVEGVQLLGTNLWNTPELLSRESAHLQGAIFLDGFFIKRNDDAMSDFVRRFYAIYGDEPTVLEANAFDSVRLALEVLRNTKPDSRPEFSNALEDIRQFPGVTGSITIGEDRDARRKLTPLIVDKKEIIELR